MSGPVQVARLRQELEEATRGVHDLAERAGPERWARRPPAGGWSVGLCIEHLNITSESFLPELERVLGEAAASGPSATGEYRLGPVGWLLCRMLEPPYRMRVTTSPPFEPSNLGSPGEVLGKFDALQARLDVLLAGGQRLALDQLRVVSPFSPLVKYSAYAAFRVIAVHQRRHIWQAGRVLEALEA